MPAIAPEKELTAGPERFAVHTATEGNGVCCLKLSLTGAPCSDMVQGPYEGYRFGCSMLEGMCLGLCLFERGCVRMCLAFNASCFLPRFLFQMIAAPQDPQ